MTGADARLLVITPVHNEARHLEAVTAAMLAQTRTPDLWLIVDDNSQDASATVAAAAIASVAWARLLRTPPGYTADTGDRNAAGGPDRAFNFGLDQVDWGTYTHVVKLDGDIVAPPEYLAGLLDRFAADPQLGIAGGAVQELRGGAWRTIPTPADHPTAPARMYTTGCLQAIGGMPPRMGADVITTIYAKLRGYTTSTFADLAVRHLRPMATADGVRQGRMRQGAYQYIVHYHPLWILARTAVVAVRFEPRWLSGWWFLRGYVKAARGPTEPVADPEFRAFILREQRQRLVRALHARRS